MSKKKFSLFMAIILMATSVYPGGYVFAEDAVAEESAIETPTEERVADEEEAEILTETTELIAQESQTTIAEEAQSTEDTDVSEILVEDIVEVETPAENTELAIGGEMQQGLNAESIAEDEESPKITNLEFENLPRFNMLGSGQFYLVQVKATFSDGSTGTSSSWTGDVDRYGKNGLCADIYGENGVVKGRVWMSLLKDGERLHDFDGGFGTDDEIIFGEYTLEVYDEKNENMRISTQITVERPSELTDISLGNPVSFSMQKYGNAWYKLQVPKTGTYCFPLALSKGNLSGIIATYNENETGVIVKHWFSSSKGFSMELMEGQTYVVYLYMSIYDNEGAEGTFAVDEKQEITSFDFKQEQITVSQKKATELLYNHLIPATVSYGDKTYEISKWSGYELRKDTEIEITTFVTQQGGDKIGLLLLNSDGEMVTMPYYLDRLEVGEYTLRGYVCGATNADEQMVKEMKLIVTEPATGSIDFQYSEPYSKFESEDSEKRINLFTNAPMTIHVEKSDLKEGREYTIEWDIKDQEEPLEEGTYNYVTYEQTDDDTLLLVGHAAEKGDDKNACCKTLIVTARLVCNGETVDSYQVLVNPVQPIYDVFTEELDETKRIKKNDFITVPGMLKGYVYDATHDYADVEVNVTDVSVNGGDSGIVTIMQESDEMGRYWKITGKDLGTADIQITYKSLNPELETESFTFTVKVVPYLYHLSANLDADSGKWWPVLYMEDELPIKTELWVEKSDGFEEVPIEEYSVVYTTEDTNLITITEEGLVKSGNELGEVSIRVAAIIDGEEVAWTNLDTAVESERTGIDLEGNTFLSPGKEYLLRPFVKYWSKEHRSGEIVPGNWTYKITEMDPRLTRGRIDCSVVVNENAQIESIAYITIEAVNEQGETYSISWGLNIIEDSGIHVWDDGIVTKQPTCAEAGVKIYSCSCGEIRVESVPAFGHTWDEGKVTKEATCGAEGMKTYICKNGCGAMKTEAIQKTDHIWDEGKVTKEATCGTEGVKTYTCKNGCGAAKTEALAKTGSHSFGASVTISEATVFEKEKQEQACSVCGEKQIIEVGELLEPVLKVTAGSLKMKQKQTTTKFKVTEMAAGDSLESVVSSNTKIVKVSGVKADGAFKLSAQKKGSAKLTITLKSGVSTTVNIKVQSAKVKTTKISNVPKKISLKEKKQMTLEPVLTPVTSQDKINYTSSNKSVVTISNKGIVTAKKKGTAKITIRAGKKKCTVIVKVTK